VERRQISPADTRTGHRRELLDLREAVLSVVGVIGVIAAGLKGLPHQVPIVIVRVRKVRVLGELVADIVEAAIGRAVAHRIVRERLIEGQRMGGGGQSVERVVPKCLRPAAIREARPPADSVVHIVRLIDLRARGRNLVQDVFRDL